jgi:hypothetical protein
LYPSCLVVFQAPQRNSWEIATLGIRCLTQDEAQIRWPRCWTRSTALWTLWSGLSRDSLNLPRPSVDFRVSTGCIQMCCTRSYISLVSESINLGKAVATVLYNIQLPPPRWARNQSYSHVVVSFVPMENLVHGPPEDTSSLAWAHLIFESVACYVRYLSHVMLWRSAYFEYLVSHPPSCLQVAYIMSQGTIDTFSRTTFRLSLHGSAFVHNQPNGEYSWYLRTGTHRSSGLSFCGTTGVRMFKRAVVDRTR